MDSKVLACYGLLLIAFLVSTCSGDVRCLPKSSPPGVIQYCRYNDEMVTWGEADMRCRKGTSTLAVDRDREAHDILRSLTERYSTDPLWIGGRTGRGALSWINANGTVSPLRFEVCYYAENPVINKTSDLELLPEVCRNYYFHGTSKVAKRIRCLCNKTDLGQTNPRSGSYGPKCKDYNCRKLYDVTTVKDLPVTLVAHHREELKNLNSAYHKDAMCLSVTAVSYRNLLFISMNCEKKLPAIYHSKTNENQEECILININAFYCIEHIPTSWSMASLRTNNGSRSLAVLDSQRLGQLAVLLINKELKEKLFWVSATNNIWMWADDSRQVNHHHWADLADAVPSRNVCMEYLRSGQWRSLMCSKKRHYICQKIKGSNGTTEATTFSDTIINTGIPKKQTFPRYMYFVIIIIMAAITISTAWIFQKVQRQRHAWARVMQTTPRESPNGLSLVQQTTDQEGGHYEIINDAELTYDQTTGIVSLNGSIMVENELYEESSRLEIHDIYGRMETHECFTHYQEIRGDNYNHRTDANAGSMEENEFPSPSDNKTGHITDECQRQDVDDIGLHRCSSVHDATFLVDNDIYE